MELDSLDILNEVDVLLSRLDKLPDNVRLQALQKLSQKVSSPKGHDATNKGKLSKALKEGTVVKDDTSPLESSEVHSAQGQQEPEMVIDAIIKQENFDDEEDVHTTMDVSCTSTEGNDQSLEVKVSHEIKPKTIGMLTNELNEQSKFDHSLTVESDRSTGRRKIQKINYRHLSEFGINKKTDKHVKKDIKDSPKKRGRGRPPKGNKPQCVLTPDVGIRASATQTEGKYDGVTARSLINSYKSKLPTEDLGEEYDLLESCLKESGINDVDAQHSLNKLGTRVAEDTKKEADIDASLRLRETLSSVIQNKKRLNIKGPNSDSQMNSTSSDLEDEKQNEDEDLPTIEDNVIICDSLESLAKINKRKYTTSGYKCDECGKLYTSMSSLRVHKIRHRKKEDLPFKCEHCDFRSATKIDIVRHQYKHSKSSVFICEICGTTFARDTSLREHIEYVHAKMTKLKCSICDFVTHRRSSMRVHINGHKNTQPAIACPICGVTYKAKTHLRAHLLTHAEAKDFACDKCDKKFIMRNRLVAHQNQVHGSKDFVCGVCSKKFPTIHHLKRHVRIHTGERPYRCCFCAFSFNVQGNLIKHIRQIHDKMNFSYKDYLREIGEQGPPPKLDEQNLAKLKDVGKDVAQKLLPELEKTSGQPITLEALKEKDQKKRELHAATMQEHYAKRRRRVLRKPATIEKNSSYCIESDGKITLYTITGGTETEENNSNIESSINQKISIENELNVIDEDQCWLTHTDENGCVMLIPCDVSLINGADRDDPEDNDQTREWENGSQLTTFKMEKDNCNESSTEVMTVQISSEERLQLMEMKKHIKSDLSFDHDETDKNQLSVGIANLHKGYDDVESLSNVVDNLDTMSMSLDSPFTSYLVSAKPNKSGSAYNRIPESIQVIASNEPVDDMVSPSANLLLPDKYIIDDEEQVLQLTSGTEMDPEILLDQMADKIEPAESRNSTEYNTNSTHSHDYSFISTNTEECNKQTFVITTKDDDHLQKEEIMMATKSENLCIQMEEVSKNVTSVDIISNSEKEDTKKAIVLFVNAEDFEEDI